MKRLVRSRLDPLPRSLSTKSLALLVAMLLSGIGISVNEFLESRRVPERAAQSVPSVLQECTREEVHFPNASKPTAGSGSSEPAPSTGARFTPPSPGLDASNPAAAPTGWIPESDTASGPTGAQLNSVSER
jgi:hypothetical protein